MSLKRERDWSTSCKPNKDALWYEILFHKDKLGLDKNVLKHMRDDNETIGHYVNERLLTAATSIQSTPGELSGITSLLHIASVVILSESNRERIDQTLDFIKEVPAFNEIDPTTIITTAALYYLIHNAECMPAIKGEYLSALKHIHKRLDHMNWFVGNEAMEALKIERSEDALTYELVHA
ncbi:MAG: hypothetical protein OEV28_11495 [Nitrospirota bacterium]|nr:hypothetical protein [Nitrospirota bacterium]